MTLSPLPLRLYCKMCKTEKMVSEPDLLDSGSSLCRCGIVLRPALENGDTDWQTVSHLCKEGLKRREQERDRLQAEVQESGYAVRTEGEKSLYFVLCPHPDCDGLLPFRRHVHGDLQCICHACDLTLQWRSGVPSAKWKAKQGGEP